MNKYSKIVLVAGLAAAFVIGGAYATTSVGAATSLEDAASLSLDNNFTGTVNQFPSVKIGTDGVGGVTFFNGTIINVTEDAGVANPVTFGDDVRIDGRIWRGETAGTSDTMPVIINDNAEVAGDLSQDVASAGTVKALASVASDGTLNSSQENITNGDYSFASARSAQGVYTIDFNFDISDRYVVVTPRGTDVAPTAASVKVNGDGKIATVYIVDLLGGPAAADAAFDIAVY